MQIKQTLIENLPEIIRESVKPMEQIDGLNDGNGSGAAGEGGSGSLADQMVNSALRYRGQAPLVDSLLSEIGLKRSNINGLQDLNKGDEG